MSDSLFSFVGYFCLFVCVFVFCFGSFWWLEGGGLGVVGLGRDLL